MGDKLLFPRGRGVKGERRATKREGGERMRASALFPYLIIVCGVMTVYSAFLLHLSRSVRTDTAVFPVSPRLRPSVSEHATGVYHLS